MELADSPIAVPHQPENIFSCMSPNCTLSANNSQCSLNTSFQYGNVSDPRLTEGIPYNHVRFIASVWPGSNVCCDIQPCYNYESSPSLVYAYYPVDGAATGCNSSPVSPQNSMPTSAAEVMPVCASALFSASQMLPLDDTKSCVNSSMTGFPIPVKTTLDPSGVFYDGKSVPGYHALNGCWYPAVPLQEEPIPAVYSVPGREHFSPWITSQSQQLSPEIVRYQQDRVDVYEEKQHFNAESAHPSKPLSLPQPYNCYRQLDKAMEMLGRPRLFPSTQKTGLP